LAQVLLGACSRPEPTRPPILLNPIDTLRAADREWGLSRAVMFSDHGEELPDHGSVEGHGWKLYATIVRVPFSLEALATAPAASARHNPTASWTRQQLELLKSSGSLQ
jgi:hypothetical protein